MSPGRGPGLRGAAGRLARPWLNAVGDWWRRLLRQSLLLAACSLVALAGVGFLVAAAYLGLRVVLAPWAAALATGGILLVTAAAGLLAARLADGGVDAPAECVADEPREQPVDVATRLGEDLGAHLGRRGVRTTDLVFAGLVAGTVLGASPALRQRLFRRDGGDRGGGSARD